MAKQEIRNPTLEVTGIDSDEKRRRAPGGRGTDATAR
jgi:hypothetical protein